MVTKTKKQLFNEIFDSTNKSDDYDPEDIDSFDSNNNNNNNSKQSLIIDEEQDNKIISRKSALRTKAQLDEALTTGKYSGHSVRRSDLFSHTTENEFEALQSSDYMDDIKRAKLDLAMEREGFTQMDDDDASDSDDDDDASRKLKSHLSQLAVDSKSVMESIQKDRMKQKIHAQSVLHQKTIYNQLLKTRILLQKPLVVANQLPQGDLLLNYLDQTSNDDENDENEESVSSEKKRVMCSEVRSELFHLLCDMLDMQSQLLTSNEKCLNQEYRRTSDDSEDDEDEEATENTRAKKKSVVSGETLLNLREAKRQKLDKSGAVAKKNNSSNDFMEQLWQVVNESYEMYSNYREESLDKWNRKTRMQSALNSKQFKTMNMDIVSQVKSAMNDDRMKQRAHVKRFPEKILGKRTRVVNSDDEDDEEEIVPDSEEEVIDEEIFDDKDFYQTMLRDLIQDVGSAIDKSGSASMMSAIQKASKTKNRKEPVGKTKDRSIVYNVHEKLVSFMAPVESEIPKSAETLFLNLFGGGTVVIDDEDED